jgi:hypothetical protein
MSMNKVRYRVKAVNDESFNQVCSLLRNRVKIFVASDKRRVLSTGEIPRRLLRNLKEMGATVTTDFQYDQEDVPSALTKLGLTQEPF